MLKRIAIPSMACALLLSSAYSYAAGTPYIGIQVGQGNTHYDTQDVHMSGTGQSPSSASIHNKTLSGRIFAGYELNQNMAAELGFQHLGNTRFNHLNNTTQRGYVREFAYDIVVKPSAPFGEQAKVYAKLGAAYVRSISHGQLGGSRNQFRPTYGIGISAGNVTRAPVFLEWSRIHRSNSIPHADLISVGVKYCFDQPKVEAPQINEEAAPAFTTEMENAGIKVHQEGDKTILDIPSQVSFDYNKAIIKPEFRGALNKIAAHIKQHPSLTASIEGHTDNIGSQAYNLKLSERRAGSVYHYLTSHGIAAKRLTTKGYGKLHPIASNATEEGRAENRRVEIILQQ